MTSFRLPVGPFQNGAMETRLAEGALDQQAFRLDTPDLSTLELIQSLRGQLAAAGYQVLYECETAACGGFDFRYGTDVLPEPDMHVDLGDFRYLAAERTTSAGQEFLSLVVSRSRLDSFVQVTRIGGRGAVPVLTTSSKSPLKLAPAPDQSAFSLPSPAPAGDTGTTAASATDLGKRLELGTAQVLEDLVFASGSSKLEPGDYPDLGALADWLKADPARRVVLVGHTDASGGLAGNISLSKARAASVRQFLITSLDVPGGQIDAEGVGYLSPRDTNQTEAGRQHNRRVEVMATSTPLLAP